MAGKVDPRVQNARSAKVRHISARKQHQFHDRYLGAAVEVLFEHEENGYWTGYTGNYIRVAVCSEERLDNAVRRATVTRHLGDMVFGALRDCDSEAVLAGSIHDHAD